MRTGSAGDDPRCHPEVPRRWLETAVGRWISAEEGMPLGGASKCPRCDKAVYFAEEVAAKGKKWHKSCLTCGICNKGLDTFTLNEHENNVYCKGCFSKNFGPKGYGFAGGGGGVVGEGDSVGGYHAAMLYSAGSDSTGNKESSPNDCPRCKKPVYYAEEKIAIGRKWHKMCFKCGECKKMLDSSTVAEHDGDAFCKTCYGKLFGPKGYGFAGGSAGLSANTDVRYDGTDSQAFKSGAATSRSFEVSANPGREASANPARVAQMSGGGASICAQCGTSVYFAEEVIAAGRKWHKLCLKCAGCGKLLDGGSVVEREGVPHCKACYGKKYGPKGYGFAGGGAGLSANHDIDN